MFTIIPLNPDALPSGVTILSVNIIAGKVVPSFLVTVYSLPTVFFLAFAFGYFLLPFVGPQELKTGECSFV
jgi:hypothetical protein